MVVHDVDRAARPSLPQRWWNHITLCCVKVPSGSAEAPTTNGSPPYRLIQELLELYPSRSAVPHDVWRRLIAGTREALDVLIYAGTFLFEQHQLGDVVREKARDGVRFRILLGDETATAVRLRAKEEGTAGGLEGRIQLHRRYLRGVLGLPGVEVRTHGTTLYNSLFRFDQDLLVNGHAYGAVAGQSPVLHLRRVPGGLFISRKEE